ncbi:MAG: DNA repair protein RadA [Eubacterium sp.]|nr:DNA repair protein RadA [Eubacterium sp.]
MAKRKKTVFVCQECGYESSKWMGQCICGAWNSFVEETVPEIDAQDSRRRTSSRQEGSRVRSASPLREVGTGEYTRMDTGIGELNRVLGGGLVRGSLVLISGEPGIGKSTIIMQAASNIADGGSRVLYVSGEESEEQIKMRADRICGDLSGNLYILSETNMENVLAVCETLKPGFVIIDSIQTMYTEELDSVPGSVSQVRACGNLLMKIGKTWDIPVFIVAHVTKNGELAGPKIVEHLVDCVLSFTGERDHDLRILRAYKNRFGTTSEIGAFRMEEKGLVEIRDLSATFLESTEEKPEGSVVSAVYEGSRPVLLEIQALTAPANVGFSRRTAVGIDHQRLSMILAVLEKKVGMTLINQDVYVNVVGGLRPDSTSVDLAVALAVYSSVRSIRCPRRILAIGEVGLTGELRSTGNVEKIAAEAARMGYEEMIVPLRSAKAIGSRIGNCRVHGAADLREAIRIFRGE